MSLPFLWRFLFYFYCCVCICMSKRAKRTLAWVRSVQQECIFPSTGHAECPKFQTGSFVERKAPENFCGLFSPISNPEKIDCVQKSHIFPLTSSNYSIFSKQLGKQEWLCSWAVVVSGRIVANKGTDSLS